MVKDYLKILSVDEHSTTPKHVQISNAFLQAIENGKIIKDDILPSANELGESLNISINTLEDLYRALKVRGIIVPLAGGTFRVINTEIDKPQRVLVLFDQLTRPKKIILDSFIDAMTGHYIIDFYIYYNELRAFKKIVTDALKEEYIKFMIIPSFEEDDKRAYKIINSIPKEKLLLIDKLDQQVEGDFAAVFEDFEKDIYECLQKLNEPLSKYNTIKLLYPDDTYYPDGIIEGFSKYCLDFAFEYGIFKSIDNEIIKKNTVYICLDEDDLILFVDKILVSDYKIGRDVGVIAYNETPIKKIIVNGITTISTDFRSMGIKAAQMILENRYEHCVIPSAVIIRESL